MRKIVLAVGIICLLFSASCSKKYNTESNWTFKGILYTAPAAAFTGSTLNAVYDSAGTSTVGTLSFSFAGLPTANGTYHVIGHSAGIPNADQMIITLTPTSSSSTSYYSTGNDNINATVTISNSYVTVSVPNVWMRSSTNASDSAQLSGTIVQTQ